MASTTKKQNTGHICLCGDETESFPEQILGMGLTAQIVLITPNIAREWVALKAEGQRRMSQLKYQSIKDDLLNGRFILNGEPIIFDSSAKMVDGQHRLNACISSDVSFWSVVIRGVPSTAYATLGNGRPRTAAEGLRADGHVRPGDLSAAAMAYSRYERGALGKAEISMSPPAIAEVVASHPGLSRSVLQTTQAGKVMHSYGAVGFCHYLLSRKDQELADTFFEQLASGANLPSGHPILALRKRAMNDMGRMRRDEAVMLIFKTWNLVRANRTAMLIRVGSSEEFPMPI